jgi:vancomycin resistance protein YoaR
MRKKKRRKKGKLRLFLISILSVILLGLLGGGSGYTLYVRNESQKWDNLIYPGIVVDGIELGGKSKEEAKKLLKAKFDDVVVKKKINITTDKKTYSIDYSNLNSRYDIDNVIDEVFEFGKDKNMFEKYKLIKEGISSQRNLTFAYDDNYVKEIIAQMEKDINKEPINASIQMISSGKFKVTPDVKGYRLIKDQLEKTIKEKINGDLSGDVNIKAPIEEVTAAITGEKLSSIDTKISSFTTNYSSSSNERAYNIEISTKAINGKLLMPGETFSFNEIVGERTRERGYREAPVIVGNKIESGLGGGICQVSSTLYNAILKTDLKSTERIHHTLPSSYVGLGLDATVDWGNLDYKFKNTLEYPIIIEGYTQNRNLYFNIYSNSVFGKRTYTIINDVYETIPSTTKTIDDPAIPEGQTEIEQKALNGYKVKVTRNTFENGQLVKSEEVSNDYYRPVTGVVKKGVKKQ